MPELTHPALTISWLGRLLSLGSSHERSTCSAVADGDVTRFSHHLCGNWYCYAALDDYCGVEMAADQRRSLSGISETLGQGNCNTVRGRRRFRHCTLIRVGIAVA